MHWGVVEKVRNLGSDGAGVALDRHPEMALVIACPEQLSPVGMKSRIILGDPSGDVRVDQGDPPLELLLARDGVRSLPVARLELSHLGEIEFD